MPSIVFASISSAVGKSAIAASVARHLAIAGKRVVASGSLAAALEGLERVRFADDSAPRVPRGSVGVFEGASGDSGDVMRIADELDAHVVLVANLGEDVVGASAAYGTRLAGVVWNQVPRYRQYDLRDSCAELNDSGIECLGCVAEDRELVAHSILSIGEHLNVETVIDTGEGDPLIETFLIGGLVLDWGPTYFESEPSTCVVVRSGRPDVQLSALQSESTRAVLMTGGTKAIDYVFYEARSRGIPLLGTVASTEEVMTSLDELPAPAFSHPAKVSRMGALLDESGVMARLLDVASSPATQ